MWNRHRDQLAVGGTKITWRIILMFLDLLKIFPQFLLPHHLLSRGVYSLTRLEGGRLTHWMIRKFIQRYRIDMSITQSPDIQSYHSFNQFFTRALKASARPLAPTGILSPVDGEISQIGSIQDSLLLQAKGRWFSLEELLGGDPAIVTPFKNGLFCTLYLSPKDYHRIHMPCTGRLTDMVYIPGRLLSVNPPTTRVVPKLFARNERLICLFDTEMGPLALILVGALFVGNLETTWTGPLPSAHHPHHWQYAPETAPFLLRGAEMGRFNMGSTVILLLDAQHAHWLPEYTPQCKVLMGNLLATEV